MGCAGWPVEDGRALARGDIAWWVTEEIKRALVTAEFVVTNWRFIYWASPRIILFQNVHILGCYYCPRGGAQ